MPNARRKMETMEGYTVWILLSSPQAGTPGLRGGTWSRRREDALRSAYLADRGRGAAEFVVISPAGVDPRKIGWDEWTPAGVEIRQDWSRDPALPRIIADLPDWRARANAGASAGRHPRSLTSS